MTQMQSVLDARTLANNGLNAVQIKKNFLRKAMNHLYIYMVDTLKYLKKVAELRRPQLQLEQF